MTAIEIEDDWLPTAENINALPGPLRDYIHRLGTLSDPSDLVQENYELRAQVRAVEAMVEKLRSGEA